MIDYNHDNYHSSSSGCLNKQQVVALIIIHQVARVFDCAEGDCMPEWACQSEDSRVGHWTLLITPHSKDQKVIGSERN